MVSGVSSWVDNAPVFGEGRTGWKNTCLCVWKGKNRIPARNILASVLPYDLQVTGEVTGQLETFRCHPAPPRPHRALGSDPAPVLHARGHAGSHTTSSFGALPPAWPSCTPSSDTVLVTW